MEKKFKVYDIDWDISIQDIEDVWNDDMYSIRSFSQLLCAFAEQVPEEDEVVVDYEEGDDLDDLVATELSDKHSWAVNRFKYEEIK